MGLSASQARQLLLTAKRNDLEFRAQQISQQRLVLSSQLEEIATDYENATSNRQMQIRLYTTGETDETQQTVNLTYKTLVSGCAKIGDATKVKVADSDYAATTAYTLKNADGAIIVSDLSEIPGISKGDSYYQKYTSYAKASKAADGGQVYYQNDDREYRPLNKIVETDDEGDKTTRYEDAETGLEVKPSRYYAAEENDEDDYKEMKTKLETGGTYSTDMSGRHYEVTKTGTVKVSSEDANGNMIYQGEYIVDPNLARGSTDQYGNTSSTGPNYLQEMLRNGVYVLEKYNTEQKEWNSVSWDSAVGISDRYYTEDDDAAKAKYDRLQNEIQRQDKKLELELDNIETQRSAITTEEESVQKVMDDNIEGTFKTFA